MLKCHAEALPSLPHCSLPGRSQMLSGFVERAERLEPSTHALQEHCIKLRDWSSLPTISLFLGKMGRAN